MIKAWRSLKPLHRGIFILCLGAAFAAAAGCFRSEPEDPDYPGVASSPLLRRVVTGDGALKMVIPRHWEVKKPSAAEVLRAAGDQGELVIEERRPAAGGRADIEGELAADASSWRAKGFEVKTGLLKAVSAGGVPFYYRLGSRPGDMSVTLVFGLLLPGGTSSRYYLYSYGFPHNERMGGETLTVARSVRAAK
jgi:hypothetical protein